MKVIIPKEVHEAIAKLIEQIPTMGKFDSSKMIEQLMNREEFKNKFITSVWNEDGTEETITLNVEFVTDIIDILGGYMLDLGLIGFSIFRMIERLQQKGKEFGKKWVTKKETTPNSEP